MEWFWHVLVICVIVIPITIMWIAIAIEIFRRHDLNAFQRICWLLVLFMFPLLGAVVYLAVSWRAIGRRQAEILSHADPGKSASVSDLTELDRLRRSGVLTEAEFEAGKQRILEGQRAKHTAEEVGS